MCLLLFKVSGGASLVASQEVFVVVCNRIHVFGSVQSGTFITVGITIRKAVCAFLESSGLFSDYFQLEPPTLKKITRYTPAHSGPGVLVK